VRRFLKFKVEEELGFDACVVIRALYLLLVVVFCDRKTKGKKERKKEKTTPTVASKNKAESLYR